MNSLRFNIYVVIIMVMCIMMPWSKIHAQSLGLNNSSPDASAILDAKSTTQGILLPRMTGTQATAISSPATGLTVYITIVNGTFTSIGFWYYNGSAWTKLLDSGAGTASIATNIAGGAAGSLTYQTGSSVTNMLPLGTAGQILQAGASAPAWTSYTAPPSVATGDFWYGSATNALSALAGNSTSTKKFLTQTGTGSASAAPAWGVITAADIPSGGTNYIQNTTTQQASSNFNISGAGSLGGLLTANAGVSASGAAINLNAGSNYATNINIGTSTGTVTIGNASDSTSLGSPSLLLPNTATTIQTAVAGVNGSVAWKDKEAAPNTLMTLTDAGTTGNLNVTGALTLGTPLSVANGGSGAGTYTTNGILYGNGTGAIGVTAQGAAGTVLHGNGGVPSFSAIGLTTDVTGTLPVGNGGTGATTFGGTNTLLYTSAANTLASVAASSGAGQFLQTTTSGSAPTWLTTLGVSNGGTGTTTAPTTNGIIYGSSATAYASTAASTAAGQVLATTSSGGAPSWVSIGGVATLGATTSALSGTTEQVVLTASIPASTMNVGTTFRVHASGACTTSTGGQTANFLFRVGNAAAPGAGDALAVNINPSCNNGTAIPFYVEAYITVRATGATSTASVLGSGALNNSVSNAGVYNASGGGSGQMLFVQTTTAATSASFATTNANNIHLNVTTASANTTITIYNASIEVVKY